LLQRRVGIHGDAAATEAVLLFERAQHAVT
jgi:hypothetical protein